MARRRRSPPSDGSPAQGRGRLTRDRILDAALRVADQEGMAGLTMRRLGAELGVAPMALYMHIRSKEELLAGVSDRIAAELEVPTECSGDWATQLGDVARSMRGVLRHHQPALAIFMMTQPIAVGGNMRVAEGVFRILRRAGFTDSSVTRAFFSLMAYTFGFVALEAARGGAGTAEDRAEVQRQRRLALQSLPLREFPLIVELAPYMAMVASDEQFDYGIDRLIDGLRTELEGTSTVRRGDSTC